MPECSVVRGPPRCYRRSPLRDIGVGPGWVEGDDFTHVPAFAPRSLPTSPLPQNLAAGGRRRRSPEVGRCHVPRSITPCPPWDLKPGKSRQKQSGRGVFRNTGERSGLSIPSPPAGQGAAGGPGSAQPRARGRGCAAAERDGRRARLGRGCCGRRAPLLPLPWFVPSTFARSNLVVG